MTRHLLLGTTLCAAMAVGTACGNGGEAPPAEGVPAAAGQPGCEPSGALRYVCGPVNAEDIVQIGDSDWLVVSGMNGQLSGSDANGHIYLVNHREKTYEEWFPGASPRFAADTGTFPSCPGPLDTANFSSHGLALRELEGRLRLYMTSHGAREAIEVFDIEMGGARPGLTWVGCVELPSGTFANSVAVLSDGGFVTTKMMDASLPFEDGLGAINQGAITGGVYEWHPGGDVTAVPGTELSGANGIVVSEDDSRMFVTAIGSRELVRFDRTVSPPARDAAQVPVAPDNIRWTGQGTMYTIGANVVAPGACETPPCETGWSVIEVDPDTLVATRVAGADQDATLQGASTGVRVGDAIWIGTYQGDRIGYLNLD